MNTDAGSQRPMGYRSGQSVSRSNPFFPPFGTHMSFLTGHHPKSKFLAFETSVELQLALCT